MEWKKSLGFVAICWKTLFLSEGTVLGAIQVHIFPSSKWNQSHRTGKFGRLHSRPSGPTSLPTFLSVSLKKRCSSPLIKIHRPCWTCSMSSMSFALRSPELDTTLQMCLTRTESRGRITSRTCCQCSS